ncbi:MAG TPA: hypothetical protein VFU22_25990 [Roseiflexaceae bacterium]|nr:hypothetical protein [Roseiflexaceae bacterium]
MAPKFFFLASPDLLNTHWAIVNADGSEERSLFGSLGGDDPIWSPDGSKIAYLAQQAPLQGRVIMMIGVTQLRDSAFASSAFLLR